MLWERKPVSAGPEAEAPELIPVNMHMPKPAWPEVLTQPSKQTTETVLGKSAVLKGELSVSEDLVIEGEFEGTLSVHDRRVTIGLEARVKSDICAGEAIVLGLVEGNIAAQRRIEIRKTGHAVGDLVAPGVTIESGAYFKGRIEILNGHGGQAEP